MGEWLELLKKKKKEKKIKVVICNFDQIQSLGESAEKKHFRQRRGCATV